MCVLDVKKVANELSGPFAKVGAPQADNDSSNPPEIFHKHVFLAKKFILNYIIWLSQFVYLTFLCFINAHKTVHFDRFRRSWKFKMSAVLVLTRYILFHTKFLVRIPDLAVRNFVISTDSVLLNFSTFI